MTDEKTEVFLKQSWAYAGRRVHKDELYDEWHRMEGYTATEKGYWYKTKQTSPLNVIGGIYEVESLPDGSTARVKGMLPFKGKINDGGLILKWKAQHDTAMNMRTARKVEKLAKNSHLDVLSEVRLAWLMASPQERLMLEVVVLQYLRTGQGS